MIQAVLAMAFALSGPGLGFPAMTTFASIPLPAPAAGLQAAPAGQAGRTPAGQAIPVVGAVVNAASPVNLIVAALMPDQLVRASLQEGVGSANVALLVGGGIAAVVYGFIVFGMHASMKRSFMMTVRRLAGTK